MAVVLEIDAVVLGDGVREVGEERDVEPAEAALLARRVHPRQMREVRVHRAGDHLGTERLELCGPVVEGENLGGADEGEVQRVEEEHEVLALMDG